MGLRNLFRAARQQTPEKQDRLLVVRVNGREVASVGQGDVPCEICPDVQLDAPATIDFEDSAGTVHRHQLPAEQGWLHLSVRVHPHLGCQADAVVTERPEHSSGAPIGEDEIGIRFQPFFLPEAPSIPALDGRGLFARGLHFSGLVTPGNILLSCECDRCARTFLVRSFHAGFGETAYFYSGSSRYTLTVDARLEGAPAPLSDPDPEALAALEARLPAAPDGSRFAYQNPFRCPHCDAPFIDFVAHPEQRAGEYYGLYLPEAPPIRFAREGVAAGTPPN
ncbi:hypothetical protein LK533_15540 [Sphingomonas sp. PL-96]|uniref:hypothetical protein n=1 Tax=Sphingomonas sp. PL-96 TaxID=2887201 RepID=UPI001E61C9A7|nr:hypothetical protein [Sphingomonas sp. PL-96]MCC2978076.1 hypothetical protein [Sphingomonas sp. PL-96]